MIRALLRRFGFYHIDYGFSCGRHWMKIDGKIVAQTPGDDVWMRDEDVHRLVYEVVDHGKHWSKPSCFCLRECENPQFKYCRESRSNTTGEPRK